jgi:DNA transposition AAA+ family ATPase
MTIEFAEVKRAAPLKNVVAFNGLVKKLINRPPNVTGMGVFFGRSGLGKTQSAIYGANTSRAVYLEVGQYTTAKTMMKSILIELGVSVPRGSIDEMISQAIQRLAADPSRPLIVDEAHWIAAKRFVDVLRELHVKSRAPVIMIGEEMLPASLELFERVHNRILDFVAAEPCDIDDARTLARAYCLGLTVRDDLLEEIRSRVAGNARRIVNNLATVLEEAKRAGRSEIGLADYDVRLIATGKSPTPRSAA